LRRFTTLSLAVIAAAAVAPIATARVLRVGTYHGIPGQFRSIQAAIDAAKPSDWILIGPGDYKTSSARAPKGAPTMPAGVLITKAGLYLRGMNRNTVIVDGTKPGSAPCSGRALAQNFGPVSAKGSMGLNGIEIWKAPDVWVQNLTACNFLGGSSGDGATGNEVWWNGGAGSGKIAGHGFLGSYLNATSTYYAAKNGDRSAAQYGIFSSNWSGGTFSKDYASNFSDSGFYIGACQQQCDQTMDHVWSEYSSLGYSGSNAGGELVIENSQFDNNKDGFDTNSQNGDNPPPQEGACPNNAISPITHTHSCWVFMNNYVHDNNDPSVPEIGAAGSAPLGTGMSITGGRDDTVMNNRFVNNRAWGVILIPYPDSGPPCTGGTLGGLGPGSCLYDDWGDAVVGNSFSRNGGFGHPSNGDIAWLNFENGHATPCFSGNTEAGGGPATTSPSNLLQTNPRCDGSTVPANGNGTFLSEVLCNTQVSLGGGPPSCPSGPYPRRQTVVMHPLPPARELTTMRDPCAGVPANPWCPHPRKGASSPA
jgi:hypothetical protein